MFNPNYSELGVSPYKPLLEPDGVRLIELLPAEDPACDVHCRLIHTSLAQLEEDFWGHYIALSYVWGNPTQTRTIWIDGLALDITVNLFSAFRDSRDATKALRLWADGVCINQKDDKEKAAQISIMGKIYESAFRTIIYLGPSEADSAESKCLHAILEESAVDSTPFQKSTDSILDRKWFSRVWVFQELVFSRDPWIQCGRTRVRWEKFCNAVMNIRDLCVPKLNQNARLDSGTITAIEDSLSRLQHHTSQGYRAMLEMQLARLKYANPSKRSRNTVLELLQARRGMGVTDPRDMVYAHIGFAADSQEFSSVIDYSKTCAQVYEYVTRYYAKRNGILNTIVRIGDLNSSTRPKDLPSWVMDWTSSIPPISRRNKFSYDGPDETRFILLQNPAVLVCTPLYTRIVESVGPVLSVEQISVQTREIISARLARYKDVNFDDLFKEDSAHLLREMKQLVSDICQAWKEALQDDNSLPQQDRAGPEDGLRGVTIPNDESHLPGAEWVTEDYLCYFLRSDVNIDFLKGKSIAVMNGKLGIRALVPRYAQKGDILFSTTNRWSGTHLLARPLPVLSIHTSLDATIRKKILKAHSLPDISDWSTREDYFDDSLDLVDDQLEVISTYDYSGDKYISHLTQSPITHCLLLGLAFGNVFYREQTSVYYLLRFYKLTYPIIALH